MQKGCHVGPRGMPNATFSLNEAAPINEGCKGVPFVVRKAARGKLPGLYYLATQLVVAESCGRPLASQARITTAAPGAMKKFPVQSP